MEPDDDPAQPTGRDDQTAVGIRSSLTDDPEIENTSRQAVVTPTGGRHPFCGRVVRPVGGGGVVPRRTVRLELP